MRWSSRAASLQARSQLWQVRDALPITILGRRQPLWGRNGKTSVCAAAQGRMHAEKPQKFDAINLRHPYIGVNLWRGI
jgi:hypothetical protein